MGFLYILGGRQRKLRVRNQEEWDLYEAAVALQIDPESGAVHQCFEYKSPAEAKATPRSSVNFKSGTLVGDRLYACTSTEVLVFRLPSFEQIAYLTLPCFNDLHHVAPSADGTLLVVSTGLDMVLRCTLEGQIVEEWSVLPEAPWTRFSKDTDYRKVASTKPHKSHPNFVFELDGRVWVTRFQQRDAICLSHTRQRIHIAVERPHDGLLRYGRIYFTTVDGKIVIADSRTRQVEQTVNLRQIDGQHELLGWCRGLCPVGDDKVWVGFTRIRKTDLHENILWVRNALRPGIGEKPTHMAMYDVASKRCLQEIDLEQHGVNIVFSILSTEEICPHPDELALGAGTARS